MECLDIWNQTLDIWKVAVDSAFLLAVGLLLSAGGAGGSLC